MESQSQIKSDMPTDGVAPVKADTGSTQRENFVSKLYQMLENPQFEGIVSWNETDEGPSFIILDTAKFQESILVNEFNHANFSSFVRQLNKYDFHKVKFRDPHSRVWEFRHPYFRPENRNQAHLIKRKQQSANRRGKRNDNAAVAAAKDQAAVAVKAAEMAAKDAEDTMKGHYSDLESRMHRLEQNYMEVISALRLQQSLVERLCHEINLQDDDMEDDQAYQMTAQRTNELHKQQQQQNQQVQQLNSSMNQSPLGLHTLNQPNSNEHLQQQQQQQQQHAYLSQQGNVSHSPHMGTMQIENTFTSPIMSPAMGGTPLGDLSFASNLSALVAVDDTKVRDILIKILMKFGFSVDSVDNGIDVVQRVETTTYDYILIDGILKLLDGLSAVMLIRQMNIITPILLLSDQISSEEEMESLQRGVSAVLFRPFSQTDLYNALRRFAPA